MPRLTPGNLRTRRDVTLPEATTVLRLDAAVEGTTSIGYPADTVLLIGTIELVCLVSYLVPRTAVLGALLRTGSLGGAVATHVRISSKALSL